MGGEGVLGELREREGGIEALDADHRGADAGLDVRVDLGAEGLGVPRFGRCATAGRGKRGGPQRDTERWRCETSAEKVRTPGQIGTGNLTVAGLAWRWTVLLRFSCVAKSNQVARSKG